MTNLTQKETSIHDLLHHIVKELVSKPDEIKIAKSEKDGELLYELTVAPEDMGKVIGRQGRIVKSIRAIFKSAAAHAGIRASFDIVG